ncbi:MAG TPA: TetR family transcriptional regulator [Mycobacteriales bacterium]|jgi:AcrR family transcriptional regulator|nr:TetR family transcriptional regulator [Mycobacteriales bacterium]
MIPDAISADSSVPTDRVPEQGKPHENAPLRRQPVQERSTRRVARILDTCAELVSEVGYDALTTTVLARRAGVAIGSLYQFFPDKRAVVQALTQRFLDDFLLRLQTNVNFDQFENWWEAVDAVMDQYIEMHRTVPGFGVLHFGDVVDQYLLNPGEDNNTVVAEQLAQLLVARFQLNDDEGLRLALLVAVEASDAVLTLAFKRSPTGDPKLIAAAKDLIRGYLAGNLTSAVDQPAS